MAIVPSIMLGWVGAAWAVTFTVTSTMDAVDVAPGDGVCAAADGSCTLRAAVMESNALPGPDSIVLHTGVYTLSLEGTGENGAATGDLDILDELTITGDGPQNTDRKTVIDGAQIDRVFEVFATLRLEELTIRNGRVLDPTFGGGGGGISNSGFLYLTRVVVQGNSAMVGGGGLLNYSDAFIADSTILENVVVASSEVPRDLGGGGICNEANLHLDRSTLFNNFAAFGGGLANDASAFITNSTINGNTGTNDGGGGIWNDSDLTIVSSTIAGNFARPGSEILDVGATARLAGVTVDGELAVEGGTIELANSILAGNCVLTGDGSLVSQGHNLARDGSCGLSGPGDVLAAELRLGLLADNGGPTQTEALFPGSPAIDAGGDEALSLPGYAGDFIGACPSTDQRGIARPQGPHCDIGAYEAAPRAPSPCDAPTVAPENGVLSGHGWSAPFSVSPRDGLVLEDVRLGPRYMARQMSVPYFRLETSSLGGGAIAAARTLPLRPTPSAPITASLAEIRGELTPDGDQAVARSRLIGLSTHEPEAGAAEPASVEGVYAIDRIPPDSNNCLIVRQRYEFKPEKPRGGCEPSGFVHAGPIPIPLLQGLNCSPWVPTLAYDFFSDAGDTVTTFNAPQRFHFRDNDRPHNHAALFRDNDAFPVPPVVARKDLTTEDIESVIVGGQAKQPDNWDNYHQSFKHVEEPMFGPGCPECVHIHWRWGNGVPNEFPDKHGGTPFVPDGSNQDVEIGVAAFHPGEEHPEDWHGLIDDSAEPVHDIVFWYSATGHRNHDAFFTHGGFFQPVLEADLALAGSAPASAAPGDDVALHFTLMNEGPSFATDPLLLIQHSLPLRATFVPELSSPECLAPRNFGGRLACHFDDVAPGVTRSATVVLRLATTAGRTLTVDAHVVESRRDPDRSNNRVALSTTLVP